MMQLLDLNYDCLDYIFKYLDIESIVETSETCRSLREISESALKRRTYYYCAFGDDEIKHKKVAKTMRKVGPYLEGIDLDFCMVDSRNGSIKLLTVVKNYISDKLRELSISTQICFLAILHLQPVFKQLQKLTISEYYSDTLNHALRIDLPTLCPNLKVLKIQNCRLRFAPNPMKSFKNLVELDFDSLNRYYPMTEFVSFLEQNKQLKKLYLNVYDHPDYEALRFPGYFIQLRDAISGLENLEELRIRTLIFENVVDGIIGMKRLKELHTLEVADCWDDIPQVNAALYNLSTLTNLKHLWIGNAMYGLPDQQLIINIAVALPLLETFHTQLEWENRTIIEFIRHGRNLKTICVHLSYKLSPDSTLTQEVIRDAARARALAVGSERQPLEIIVTWTRVSCESLQAFKDQTVQRYLKYKFSTPFQESKRSFPSY